MALTAKKILELKQTQTDRMSDIHRVFVMPWKEEIEIRKLTLEDLILAEKGCLEKNDDGSTSHSEEIRKVILVLLAVEGFNVLRDIDFMKKEPGGVVSDIYKEVIEFSGFGTSVDQVIDDKKKD